MLHGPRTYPNRTHALRGEDEESQHAVLLVARYVHKRLKEIGWSVVGVVFVVTCAELHTGQDLSCELVCGQLTGFYRLWAARVSNKEVLVQVLYGR